MNGRRIIVWVTKLFDITTRVAGGSYGPTTAHAKGVRCERGFWTQPATISGLLLAECLVAITFSIGRHN
jgi:hypothetical protein